MKYLLPVFILLLSQYCRSQSLNEYGHFVDNTQSVFRYSVKTGVTGSEIEVAELRLKGSSAFRIADGFLTLSGNYENAPSTLRVYSNNGTQYFSETYPQTINLKFSGNKKFCAFHDREHVRVVDLKNFKSTLSDGSNVFVVNDEGLVAVYNEKTASVTFNNRNYPVQEPVYKIIFFKDKPLFITRQKMLGVEEKILTDVFEVAEGRIFDAAIFNNELYISIKKEQAHKFVFTSFKSTDLKTFTPVQEKCLKLSDSDVVKDKNKVQFPEKFNSASGELIRNPIYYFNDTVFQPIGNSYSEIQEYGAPPYLHPGVDLLGSYHQETRSVKKGFVKGILTTAADYHWRIAIANENIASQATGYLYAHLDELTIPYAVGDSVEESDVIGLLVDFPVTGFVHCHFARITDTGVTWNGGWWTYDNPLSYMTNFFDTIAPHFEKTINADEFAFRKSNGVYLSPDSLYGNVKVISKVYDLANTTWHIDVNKLRYNLSPLASPQVLLLDTLAYEYDFFTDVYPAGTYNSDVIDIIYSRDANCFSTGDYNVRDFYHIVTNSDGNDTINSNDAIQFFNTLNFQDGSYIFRIIASDPSGNTSVDSMIIRIKNSTTGIAELNTDDEIKILSNPSADGKFEIRLNGKKECSYGVFNSLGEKVSTAQEDKQEFIVDLSIYKSGVYVICFDTDQKKIYRRIIKL